MKDDSNNIGLYRRFGILIAIVVALFDFERLRSGGLPRYLVLSAVVLVIAWVTPRLLARPYQMWMRFGALLHKLTNPIVLGVAFFGVLAPFGFLLRLLRRNPLALEFDPSAQSYWISSQDSGADDGLRMKQQF